MMGLLIMGAGAFSIAGAAGDWDFFMTNHKARLWVVMFGRDGARAFYGILGTGLVIGGLVAMVSGV